MLVQTDLMLDNYESDKAKHQKIVQKLQSNNEMKMFIEKYFKATITIRDDCVSFLALKKRVDVIHPVVEIFIKETVEGLKVVNR